jgi:exonuclease VII large subunit
VQAGYRTLRYVEALTEMAETPCILQSFQSDILRRADDILARLVHACPRFDTPSAAISMQGTDRTGHIPTEQTHTHMHAHTHARTHTQARTHTHTHMHTHAHACTHAHTRTHTHAHTRTRMHTRTLAHAHARAHAHTHLVHGDDVLQGQGGWQLFIFVIIKLNHLHHNKVVPAPGSVCVRAYESCHLHHNNIVAKGCVRVCTCTGKHW